MNELPDPVEIASALIARLVPKRGIIAAVKLRCLVSDDIAERAVEEAERELDEWSKTSKIRKRRLLSAFYASIIRDGVGKVKDQINAAEKLAELEGIAAKKSESGVTVNLLSGSFRMSDDERTKAVKMIREKYAEVKLLDDEGRAAVS